MATVKRLPVATLRRLDDEGNWIYRSGDYVEEIRFRDPHPSPRARIAAMRRANARRDAHATRH